MSSASEQTARQRLALVVSDCVIFDEPETLESAADLVAKTVLVNLPLVLEAAQEAGQVDRLKRYEIYELHRYNKGTSSAEEFWRVLDSPRPIQEEPQQ